MKRSKILFIFKIVIGVLILLVLIYKLDFGKVLINLKQFPVMGTVLFATGYFASVLTNAWSFFILLGDRPKHLNFLSFLKSYWLSFSIGQFSPGRSGELSIVTLLKKQDIPFGKTSATFVLHKLSTLITLLVFSALILLIYFKSLYYLFMITILFLLILIALMFLIQNYKVRLFVRKFILRKYADLLTGFHDNLQLIIKKKRSFLLSLIINSSRIFYGALIVIITLYFFSINTPLLLVAGIISISLFITFIPISFSGLGIKESAVVFLFDYLGYDAAIIGTVFIVMTSINLLMNFLAFIYLIYKKPSPEKAD